ncbi:MAG: hypothetical protein PHU25_13640 [Deltaproteobacteria bacterium]|nr:hypothetical protein [Deltaproteobacteria bacterium]
MARALAFLVSTAAAALLGASGCGPSRPGAYPSYEATVAQYAPRVWYHNRWVYDHDGHWEYWDEGWWWYPEFHGRGSSYGVPVRSIRKR